MGPPPLDYFCDYLFNTQSSRLTVSGLFALKYCASFETKFMNIGCTVAKLHINFYMHIGSKYCSFSWVMYKSYGKRCFLLKFSFIVFSSEGYMCVFTSFNPHLSAHKQISTLRTIHEQLTRLLSPGEQEEVRLKDAFSAFSGLNPLQYNPYTEPQWRAAVTQYERGNTGI